MEEKREDFSLKRLFIDYVLGVIEEVQTRQLFLYAAQSSFFIITSFVPFVILFVTIIELMHFDNAVIVSLINRYAPEFLGDAVSTLISDVFSNSPAIVSLAVISLIWSAAKAIQGISYGLNNLMDVPENRNYFVLRWRAIAYTVVVILLFAATIFFAVYGGKIRDMIMVFFNLETTPFLLKVLLAFRYLISLAVLTFLFTYVYVFFPNKVSTTKNQIAAGFICALAWLVFTGLIALYVRYFNAFSIYGNMFMVLLWMLWLYIGMSIFFICGMCQPMINYLFKCLFEKIGGGKIIDVPVPKHATEFAGVGQRMRTRSDSGDEASGHRGMWRQFAEATIEPIKKVIDIGRKKRAKK
ncbi:MAG: YihY/virulence factor BrkB family protein [Eubacterium sp.]|nr:YihY/virulence factor BrkB family protein [Eubacterium sp.]